MSYKNSATRNSAIAIIGLIVMILIMALTACKNNQEHRYADYFKGYDSTNWYVSMYGNDINNGHYPDSSLNSYNELWKRGHKPGDTIFWHGPMKIDRHSYTVMDDWRMVKIFNHDSIWVWTDTNESRVAVKDLDTLTIYNSKIYHNMDSNDSIRK